MFHFQSLDVYKCAVAFLPLAYRIAKLLDAKMAGQLRRAALMPCVRLASRNQDWRMATRFW